jgi:hypothetical protein
VGILAALFPVRSTSPVVLVEATTPVETQIFPYSDYSGMPVQDVQVEIGVGSPIPVTVVASGEWPTLCSQLAQTHLRYLPERQIHIELLADPGDPSCAVDRLNLPFSLRIPLNMVEMPVGKYSVIVNGVQTDFEWNEFQASRRLLS